jgi:hypothetical protein
MAGEFASLWHQLNYTLCMCCRRLSLPLLRHSILVLNLLLNCTYLTPPPSCLTTPSCRNYSALPSSITSTGLVTVLQASEFVSPIPHLGSFRVASTRPGGVNVTLVLYTSPLADNMGVNPVVVVTNSAPLIVLPGPIVNMTIVWSIPPASNLL